MVRSRPARPSISSSSIHLGEEEEEGEGEGEGRTSEVGGGDHGAQQAGAAQHLLVLHPLGAHLHLALEEHRPPHERLHLPSQRSVNLNRPTFQFLYAEAGPPAPPYTRLAVAAVRILTPPIQMTTLPQVDTNCAAPSLITTVNGNTVRSFSTHGQQTAAKGSSTTETRSDIRLIQHLVSSALGLVRRWRLIGYFPIHLLPLGSVV
jgi:hypothetical protein